jgi:hypothetical protein
MKTTKRTFWRKHYVGFTPMVLHGEAGQGPEARTYDYFTVEDIARGHTGTRDEEYEIIVELAIPITREAVAELVARGNESLRRSDEESQRETDEAEFARLAEKLGKSL